MDRRTKYTLLQRRYSGDQQVNRKKSSSSLMIRELQIKTTMNCHLTPVRMAIYFLKKAKQVLARMWWECRLVQPLQKTVWKFLKISKIDLPKYLSIPCCGFQPNNAKSLIQMYIYLFLCLLQPCCHMKQHQWNCATLNNSEGQNSRCFQNTWNVVMKSKGSGKTKLNINPRNMTVKLGLPGRERKNGQKSGKGPQGTMVEGYGCLVAGQCGNIYLKR